VEQYKLPDNAIKDQNGYIIKCPLYEYDNITQIKSLKQQAIEKGEPLNAYYYKKEKTKNEERAYKMMARLHKRYKIKIIELAESLNTDYKKIICYLKKKLLIPPRHQKIIKTMYLTTKLKHESEPTQIR
jgi:hypothetical protein